MAEQLKEHIKDPGSAITHFIGMLMAIFAAIPLLLKAAREPDKIYIIAIAVYVASLILLYAASTTYHTFDKSKKINILINILIRKYLYPVILIINYINSYSYFFKFRRNYILVVTTRRTPPFHYTL